MSQRLRMGYALMILQLVLLSLREASGKETHSLRTFFLLCVEGLSNSLNKAAVEGSIHGCQISPSAPIITHLLFADDSFLFFRANTEETMSVKSLVVNYERYSGQSVNFSKSGVFFSSNVRRDKRAELSEILGVFTVLKDTKYLGLPSLIGRSKKRVFGFIKDKVWHRIQSWQSKPISKAGKLVLIKNVAQTIPSYCMSCFMLPKSLCLEIERMINQFWWSSGNGESKGIKWLSWEALSRPKCQGGLGVRNLFGFNIALLGKHCWRFMHQPQALVSRVFKASYFADTYFQKASKGSGGSYIWSGLHTAKESLIEGFRWVVGDGEQIVAVKDPWLRRKSDFKVECSHTYEGGSEKVSSLFVRGEKKWNVDLVKSRFLEVDATTILAVPIPQSAGSDRVGWTHSVDGHYDVKSRYKLWYKNNISSNTVFQSEGWNKIWRLNIPHKIRVFLWRLCWNNVPVRNRLRHKGVDVSILCPMCDNDVEHLLHVFFDCQFAAQCWSYAGLSYDMSLVESASEWLMQKIDEGVPNETSKIVMVLCGIWCWRNKKVWEDKLGSPSLAIDWSSKIITDWRKVMKYKAKRCNKPGLSIQEEEHKWRPPEEGYVKVNVDAAVQQASQTCSMGMVIRDHQSNFVEGRTMKVLEQGSVFALEALGVCEALKWSASKGFQKVIIETDS